MRRLDFAQSLAADSSRSRALPSISKCGRPRTAPPAANCRSMPLVRGCELAALNGADGAQGGSAAFGVHAITRSDEEFKSVAAEHGNCFTSEVIEKLKYCALARPVSSQRGLLDQLNKMQRRANLHMRLILPSPQIVHCGPSGSALSLARAVLSASMTRAATPSETIDLQTIQ